MTRPRRVFGGRPNGLAGLLIFIALIIAAVVIGRILRLLW
jgi:hypothetical protein